jgi:hypothetical protein
MNNKYEIKVQRSKEGYSWTLKMELKKNENGVWVVIDRDDAEIDLDDFLEKTEIIE